MIPTLILFGLVFGRWWLITPILASVVWPIVLLANGSMELEWGLVGAAGLALLNTLVGVLLHQALLWVVRRLRQEDGSTRAR